jgi:carotenoid cleavage dioxygenase
VHGAPFDAAAARPYLTRWTVDMASNSDAFESVERLTDMIGEFPRIDDRFATRRHRHGWMLVMDPAMPFEGPGGRASGFVMNRIGHIDFETGQQTSWWAGPQAIVQEPCFVPRSCDAAEGDGYLIALTDNLVTNYSDLIILDARKIEEGPIARAKLPFRLRSGLHGNWASAPRLAA